MVGHPETKTSTRTLRIAFLGPTPPPVMGPAIATSIVLSDAPPPDIRLIHLDTADRRSLATLGKIDFGNIWQAIRMYFGLLGIIVRYWPHVVYIPISQTKIGFLRDSFLILIAWIFRRKISLHLRGGNFDDFTSKCGWLMRGWVRFTLRRAHSMIVLGECLKQQFTPFLAEDRIHVVPNGEDFPEFRPRVETPPTQTHAPVRVVYLGNMIPLKGPGDLLRAIPDVLRAHPATHFRFAGSWRNPEFQTWAETFVAEHKLGNAVEFLGPVDRETKTNLLANSDLFVFPSTREGHPWVIVEALAAGLPIVSCDAGCIRECVHNERNGVIAPMRDPATLAAIMNDLIGDREKLERMARESRKVYEEGFTRTHFRGRLFEAMRKTASVS